MSGFLAQLLLSPVWAATLTVGPAGADHLTIGDAVAASSAFDTIEIQSGTYTESVTVGHDLLFIGVGPEPVIWQGTGTDTLYISTGQVQVANITFRNAHGRCIRSTGTYLEVADSLFDACGIPTLDGGSISTGFETSLSVRTTSFSNGQASNGGFIDVGGSALIVDSNFDVAVVSGDGGAIYVDGVEMTIEGSSFTTNHADGRGGAIYASGLSQAFLGATVLSGNSSGMDGGAIWASSSFGWFDLYHSRLCNNISGGSGGAVHHEADYSWIYNTAFVANEAMTDGGAVQMSSTDNTEVVNNVFLANTCTGTGGGLNSTEEILSLQNAFVDNTTEGWAGLGSPDHSHNLYWPDASALVGQTLGVTDLVADPLFVDIASLDCEVDLHPAVHSPLIDAGDPHYESDADNSVADIGIYGTTYSPDADADGDGTPDEWDCDPTNPQESWSETEVCDGIQQNCFVDEYVDTGFFGHIGLNGIDLSTASVVYPDRDFDGHGDANADPIWGCPGPGVSTTNDDCDDDDEHRFPHNPEVCDGQDNDCDPGTDGGTPQDYFLDIDGDLQGAEGTLPMPSCTPIAGRVTNDDDCDDANEHIFLGQHEICNGIDDDCDDLDDEGLQQITYYADQDSDDFGDAVLGDFCAEPPHSSDRGGDCNDHNPDQYPHHPELCDGVDNDCDGNDDNGLAFTTWYVDSDGDGLGSTAQSNSTCDTEPPTGFTDNTHDCNDNDDLVGSSITFYADDDDDTYGDPGSTIEHCDLPAGYVTNSDDCDDGASAINPATKWYLDADHDGAGTPGTFVTSCTAVPGHVLDNTDCDDTDSAVQGEIMVWLDHDGDGFGAGSPVTACSDSAGFVDNELDCNDNDANAFPGAVWYLDADADGYGDLGSTSTACLQPAGHVANHDDCLDSDRHRNPLTFWYADTDNDGLGDPNDSIQQCATAANRVRNDDDCSDADSNLGAAFEHWVDGDLDGYGDELATPTVQCPAPGQVGNNDDCDDTDFDLNPTTLWYLDADQDDSGAPGTGIQSCEPPAGRVRDDNDCDDNDVHRSPTADEICDSIDNDCDGLFDDDDDAVDATTWYLDEDGDGYGVSTTLDACLQPTGYAAHHGDCDDTAPLIHPNAAELCDGIDNDCDPTTDDDTTDRTWYEDIDGDGWGTDLVVAIQCSPPPQASLVQLDCDDDNTDSYPHAPELCDGEDNDCDGDTDEEAINQLPFWPDTDTDQFGDSQAPPVFACSIPAGHVPNQLDCDDTNSLSNPMRHELCDGEDNDCDGLADNGASDALDSYLDNDDDGYGNPASHPLKECVASPGRTFDHTDCNDANAAANPGHAEICDSIDNNCDGQVDEGLLNRTVWLDGDQDGFGNPNLTATADGCVAPPFTVDNDLDCDDGDAAVNPEATEIPGNGIDDDCLDGDEHLPSTPPDTDPPTPVDTDPPTPVDTDPPGDTGDPDETVVGTGLWFCSSSEPAGMLPLLFLPLLARRRR